MSQKSSSQFEDEPDPEELAAADAMAEYIDRIASGEDVDISQFLEDHGPASPQLHLDLEMLDELGAIVEGAEPSLSYGDFQVIRELGRGGMGIVFEARQATLDRRVALKVMTPGLLVDPRTVARFEREARVAGSLRHPNLVPVYSMGVEGGTPYYAMELAEGQTLQGFLTKLKSSVQGPGKGFVTPETERLIRSALPPPSAVRSSAQKELANGPASPPSVPSPGGADPVPASAPHDGLYLEYCRRIAEAFAGAAEGLQHVHSQRILHRDLKPSNLILSPDGRLRIVDFGLAWVEDQPGLTQSRERVGTVLYMSPEQARGRRDGAAGQGAAIDIYGLGASLYEALAGHPPFEGDDNQVILQRIQNEDPQPLRGMLPEIPRDLETVTLKCLLKRPVDRYATAEALAQDLRRFVRGDPVEARPQALLERVSRRAWRLRWKIVHTTIGCALATLLALFALSWRDEEARRREERFSDALHGAVLDLRQRDLFASQPSVGRLSRGAVPRAPRRVGVFEDMPYGGMEARYEVGTIVYEAGPDAIDPGPDAALEAIPRLEQLAREHPEKAVVPYYLARGLTSLGRWRDAQVAVERARDVDAGHVPSVALAAFLARQQGDLEDARSEADLARALAEEQGPGARAWLRAFDAELAQDWEEVAKAGEDESLFAAPDGAPDPLALEALLGRGLARLRTSDLVGAMGDFRQLRALEPRRLEPALLAAKVDYLNGHREEAAAAYQRLLEGTRPELRDRIARWVIATYRDGGEPGRALEWISSLSPRSETLRVKAELLSALDRHEEALAAATEALRTDPRSVSSELTLGNILRVRGELEGASQRYEAAAALAPLDARPPLLLGLCREDQGLEEEAERLFARALKVDATSVAAHHALGRALARRGQLGDARRHYEEALKVEPRNGVVLNDLALLLDELEEPLDALEVFQRAALRAPGLDFVRYNLASAYQRQDRFAEAEPEYRKAWELGLQDSLALLNRGVCLHHLKRYHEAIGVYSAVIQRNAGYVHNAYYSRGVAFDWLENHGAALEDWKRAVALQPNWIKALEAYADALDEYAGRPEEALPCYRKLLGLDPSYVYAYSDIARIHLRDGLPLPEGSALAAEIRLLEGGVGLVNASPSVGNLLERCRRACLPRLASFASADWLLGQEEALVPRENLWRHLPGDRGPPPADWIGEAFDDTAWGQSPGGYAPGGAESPEAPPPSAPAPFHVVYLRTRFEVAEPGAVASLTLRARARDGLIVYLNGIEVGRVLIWGAGESLEPDERADAVDFPEPWVEWPVPLPTASLRAGSNVLALAVATAPGLEDSPPRAAVTLQATRKPGEWMAEVDATALEAFRSVASHPGDADVLSYLEGRVLERRGDLQGALARLEPLTGSQKPQPEVSLRIASILQAQGDPGGALDELRAGLEAGLEARLEAGREAGLEGGLEKGLERDESLWRAWLHQALVVEALSPAEALVGFPESTAPVGKISAFGREARWLLERLAAREPEPLRINCGGQAIRDGAGRDWHADAFFRGGQLWYLKSAPGPGASADAGAGANPVDARPEGLVLRTVRWQYDPRQRLPVYAIPLPPATYRVTLLFSDTRDAPLLKPGPFDVLLEDEVRQERYEPRADPRGAPPAPLVFEVPVEDGELNIDFARRSDACPGLAGIEVEPLDR